MYLPTASFYWGHFVQAGGFTQWEEVKIMRVVICSLFLCIISKKLNIVRPYTGLLISNSQSQ